MVLTTDQHPVPSEAALNNLIEAARQARERAYAPYSRFRVGAALLGEDGVIYSGCNIENGAYGLTNCAERTALFKAVSEGCRRFKALVLTSDAPSPVTPCGACRQVLGEFAPLMPVYMVDDRGRREVSRVSDLLPGIFRLSEAIKSTQPESWKD
ncbi:cytidine deaminase [Heliomicrobium modesticaldum Ice1]|uniref:Cytidine deaminase n=1 Tax=Heliobacterium modesticaldum (strain ATCC 51547 / Ice1) TaxID=498761 RepID=B0TAF0_HELMI|nr:cytidine deaminase [Heliomicrobium modesticaldum]ABZ85000.1 cytidine deaminase [Heliomicrobium modesticaldum Ice1]